MGTKESKVTGRNSRDWEKKKKKETKLKYFQLAQIVKTPLCGTTWWVMIIVKQGKIIIYNHSCVIWIDNNANLHPSSYQKLWHNPQNVLAAYGANPMSFFSIYASRHLFSFGTLPMGWKPLKFPVWWSHKGSCFCSCFFSFFPLAGFVYTIFLTNAHHCQAGPLICNNKLNVIHHFCGSHKISSVGWLWLREVEQVIY